LIRYTRSCTHVDMKHVMRFHKTGHLIAYLRLGTRLSLWPGESHLNQVYPEAFTGLVPLEHVYFDEHSILSQTTHAAASPGNTGTFKQACYPHYDDIFESTYGRVHIESRGRQSRPELHPRNRPGVFLGFTTLKHTYGAVYCLVTCSLSHTLTLRFTKI